jgi:acyl-CoA synthetase (AMP-forming)/AMP-acid ligase II
MTMAQSAGAPLTLDEDDPVDPVAALHRAAQRFPAHGVTTVDDATVHRTYPELLRRARELLTGLRAHGLRPGDPVVLHGLPLADFFPSFWACLLGGLVPVTIAEPWTPDAPTERLAHICRLLGGPLVLTGADAAAPARAATASFGPDRPSAVTSVGACAGDPATDLHTPAPDDVALLILSSGSTGLPKAVRLTHHALAEGAASFRRAMDLQPSHVTLNWLPVDHSGALILYHLNEVFAGATNVHVPTETVLANPLRWLDLLTDHHVNHSWAPMFGYQLVTDALAARGRWWRRRRPR